MGSDFVEFNDFSLAPQFSVTGSVDDADPSQLPLCNRPASILKQYFQEARSRFTDYRDKWSVRGRTIPTTASIYCLEEETHSTRCLREFFILFRAARMGTADQGTFSIDLTSKATTTDGYEEGLPSSRSIVMEGESDGVPAGSNSIGSRKRRRSGSEMVDSYDSSLKHVKKILV